MSNQNLNKNASHASGFNQSNTAAMLGLVVGCIVFGLGSLIVAFVSVGAYAIAFWRLGIAAVIFILIFWASRLNNPVVRTLKKQGILKTYHLPKHKKTWFFAALAGVFLSLDLALWHESIYALGPGISTLLNSLQIFFMAAIGYVAFKEKLSLWQFMSLFIAMFGVALIASPEFAHNVKASWGFLTGIVSGAMFAASMASVRKVHDVEPTALVPLMVIFNSFGAVFIFTIALLNQDQFFPQTAQELALVFVYGSVMQCLAWGLIAYAIPKLSLAVTGLILLSEPAAALLIDYFYLHKPITILQWLGVALTLVAIYLGSVKVGREA